MYELSTMNHENGSDTRKIAKYRSQNDLLSSANPLRRKDREVLNQNVTQFLNDLRSLLDGNEELSGTLGVKILARFHTHGRGTGTAKPAVCANCEIIAALISFGSAADVCAGFA